MLGKGDGLIIEKLTPVVPRALGFEGMTAHSVGINMFFFGLFGYVL